jgi:hypothetical protein
MIIDKILSPAIKTALSGYTVSTQTVGGAAGVQDTGPTGLGRNHGLAAKPYGPGWRLAGRGATSGGAATATFTLVTDDNAALSSPTVLYTSPVFTLANMVKMDLFVPLPDTDAYERYIAWRIAVGTAVFTGGTLSVEYVADMRRWRAYPAQGNR